MMTKDDIYSMLKSEIINVLPLIKEDDITTEKKLVDLGANSIDRAEIAINCMRKLAIKIEPSELAQVKNIGDLLAALYKSSNKEL